MNSSSESKLVDKVKVKSIRTRLKEYFKRNGCMRKPNNQRRLSEGQDYKKGYEVRIGLNNLEEVREIRSLLERKKFKPGKTYHNGNKIIQPIYGKDSVKRFRKLISC
ncbi:MAG: hypothetical protein HY800_08650 [Ignavibacteriales bacterium]|nr:hypothetical protein [Ignavibacteriales bacterium]